MNMDHESERLSKELREIQREIELAKNQRTESIQDPEIQGIVLCAIVAERLLDPNDAYISRLRADVSKKREELYHKERDLTERLKCLSKELLDLTRPTILKGLEKFQRELVPLKLDEKVIGTHGGGFTMTSKVELLSNRDAILEVRAIVNKATEILHNMTSEPIPKIQAFIEETLDAIHKVDMTPKTKWMDEVTFKKLDWLTSSMAR
jgi:hypothetical protein